MLENALLQLFILSLSFNVLFSILLFILLIIYVHNVIKEDHTSASQ